MTDEKAMVAAADYETMAIDYLKSMGNELAEDDQKRFIHLCKYLQLDPFKKEIYGIPYGKKFNIIIGYQVFLARAQRHPQFNGWSTEITGTVAAGDLACTITIHRKDWQQPYKHTVWLEEYDLANSMWKSKPRTMLQKVAEGQGFRKCFAEDLAAYPYLAEEREETVLQLPADPPEQHQTPITNEQQLEIFEAARVKIREVEAVPHLENWWKENAAHFQNNLTPDQLNHIIQACSTRKKQIITALKQQQNGETFFCKVHGDERTVKDCDGLTCREHCEHFNS